MHSTYYLYGIPPSRFKNKPYNKALEIKIDAGINNLQTIAKQASRTIENAEQYDLLKSQYIATEKSIKFNRQLLEELDE